jgi:fucose permease
MAMLLLVVIYMAFISLGLPDSLFGVAWPLMHIELGMDLGFASVFTVIVGSCTAAISFVAGPVIRKAGTGKVTAVSVLMTAVALFGIGSSPSIVWVIAFAILMGAGAGAVDTGLNDFVSKHYKSRHMSWLHCFWGVGVTASPLIMSIFLDGGTWRGGYRSVSYIQFALGAIMVMSLPLWKKVIAAVGVNDSPPPPAKKRRFNVLKERGAVFAALSLAIYCGMEYLVGVWGASYLVSIDSLSPATAARYVSMYFGGIMAGRFITGLLTMKFSNKTLIRIGIVCATVGSALLLQPFARLNLPGLLMIGLGFAPIFPCTIDSTKDRFNREYSADIIGFQMGFAYVGAFAIQLGAGYLATRTTFLVIPAALLLFNVLLFADVELVNKMTVKARDN